MSLYEFIFLVRQDVSQAQVQSLTAYFKDYIESAGGNLSKEEYCGLRSLAYRIKKNKKAHYVLFHITALPAVVDELERQMRFHEDILRYLRVKVEKFDPAPSALAQTRYYRERGDDEGEVQKESGSYSSEAAPSVSQLG